MKAVIRVENFKSRKTKKAKEYIEKWILAKDLINLVKSGEVDVNEIEKKPLKLRKYEKFDY
ncbi:hypothetical protein PFDSM3638_04805 [Pyrococcus furiosus DSM 3638]|uniref:Uncharacterized protein n=2 Tax=Pyrococcus furiosus TaxID=2261 RepID=A0A5C0XS01_PYRFU|nr:hypothetical protein [Pyrococcus furiosus]AFN03753.1 hypothetical protein PFC_04020 [Pyrococcus furiosus COM1]QEK78624.1 hypothetical protein PFDSM3638_04805 [Pyrococcus furiosus DSM 3638]